VLDGYLRRLPHPVRLCVSPGGASRAGGLAGARAARLTTYIERGIVHRMPKTRPRPDFLDELIAAGARDNAAFPKLVDAALDRRELVRELIRRREALGLSQGDVAAKMGTSQPAVARLESGEVDARGSTIERFAAAVGRRIEYRLASRPRRGAVARQRG